MIIRLKVSSTSCVCRSTLKTMVMIAYNEMMRLRLDDADFRRPLSSSSSLSSPSSCVCVCVCVCLSARRLRWSVLSPFLARSVSLFGVNKKAEAEAGGRAGGQAGGQAGNRGKRPGFGQPRRHID